MPVFKYEPAYKKHAEFEGGTWDKVAIKAK